MKAKRPVTVERLRTPTFERCSPDLLGRLAEAADEVAVPPGYVLVFEGRVGDDVLVVAEGEAHATDLGQRVASVGPGGIVGAEAPRHLSPSATITAATPMRLLVFDRATYMGLIGAADRVHAAEGLAV